MSEVKLVGGAGYYVAYTVGRKIEVEYYQTSYGDRGWMALVDGEPTTEYPRATRKEALTIAVQAAQALGSPLVRR